MARGLAYPDYEDPHNSRAGDKTGRRATHGTSGLEGVRAEEIPARLCSMLCGAEKLS